MWDQQQSVVFQACFSWATLTTWGTLWREGGWALRSTTFASGGVCSRTSPICTTTRPCCRWTQELEPPRSHAHNSRTFSLSGLTSPHVKTVEKCMKSEKNKKKNKCQRQGSLITEAIFGASTASHLACPIIPSAEGERLQASVRYYTLLFFPFFSIGKEKIPLGTQVITFFRGECVGPGPVWAVCSHWQWVSACLCI